MRDSLPNPKEMGYYLTLAQAGLEMVAPMVLGIVLDSYFGWTPWATVTGAVLGFVGGVAHLIVLGNRTQNQASRPERRGDAEP